jgi:hypothetical protein
MGFLKPVYSSQLYLVLVEREENERCNHIDEMNEPLSKQAELHFSVSLMSRALDEQPRT